MTMLVVNTQPDRVEVMTDSSYYNPDGSTTGVQDGTKVALLDGLNAAATSRGDLALGQLWREYAATAAPTVDSFDTLAAIAPDLCRLAVEQVHDAVKAAGGIPPGDPHDLHAYLFGYSPRRDRFVSFIFPSTDDFAPIEIAETMHVTPAPPGIAPAAIEVAHHATRREAYRVAGMPYRPLPSGAPADVPGSDDEWAALARRIYTGCALAPVSSGLKVLVGGDVTLTRIRRRTNHRPGRRRHTATQRVVHRFTDADFAAATADLQPAGSPVGESGGHKVGRNDPCPCGAGAKYKKCCGLVSA